MKLTKEQLSETRRAVTELGGFGAYTPRAMLLVIDTALALYDGIESRDMTIRAQEDKIISLTAELAALAKDWSN